MGRAIAAGIGALILSAAPAQAHPGWDEYRHHHVDDIDIDNPEAPKRASLIEQTLEQQDLERARRAWEAWDRRYDARMARIARRQARQAEREATAAVEAVETVEVVSYEASGPYAIPTYVVMCESGGNYAAENPSSTASGAYQILDSSWDGYGGYFHAASAPPSVQDAKAALMWAGGAGWSHWAACV